MRRKCKVLTLKCDVGMAGRDLGGTRKKGHESGFSGDTEKREEGVRGF